MRSASLRQRLARGFRLLGAALYVKHHVLGQPRDFVMDHTYWGLEYSPAQCRAALDARGLRYREMDDEPLADAAATLITQGNIVGWYQGRFEWGPRALGNRSIVCDPRSDRMKDVLNTMKDHRPIWMFNNIHDAFHTKKLWTMGRLKQRQKHLEG